MPGVLTVDVIGYVAVLVEVACQLIDFGNGLGYGMLCGKPDGMADISAAVNRRCTNKGHLT